MITFHQVWGESRQNEEEEMGKGGGYAKEL